MGLEPEKDVTIVQMGGPPIRLAALQSGAVDAAILNPPYTTDPPIPSASAFRAAIEYVGRDHPSAAKLRPEDLYETSLVESAVARLGR